jgi:hypothetical protein
MDNSKKVISTVRIKSGKFDHVFEPVDEVEVIAPPTISKRGRFKNSLSFLFSKSKGDSHV